MPIPRQLFDQEFDPMDRKILDILDGDPVQAYSLSDLATLLNIAPPDLALWLDLGFRLYRLRDRRLIAAKAIHGKEYYASAKGMKA